MRVALAIAMATLTLGLASQPMHGQVPSAGAPPLETRQIVTIHMVDAQSGWAYGGGILRSIDGGTNWRDVTPPNSSGRGFSNITALSPLVAWVIRYSTNHSTFEITFEIFRTADGGRTWKRVAITGSGVRSFSFINSHEGWFLGDGEWVWPHGAAQSIAHSTDGGETWTSIWGVSSSDSYRDWIAFLNPTTGWMSEVPLSSSGRLYVTHDSGRDWQRQEIPLPGVLTPPYYKILPQPPKFFTATDGILPVFYSVRNDSGQEMMIVGFYATHDSGTTWTPATPVAVSDPGRGLPNYAVADMDHAWVTAGGVLQATRDGGRHWAQLPRNPLFAIPTNASLWTPAPVSQLDFISPEVGWAVRNDRALVPGPSPTWPAKFPFLLKSLDGGRTWSPVSYSILRQ